jgi:hypothetical protein
LDSDPEGNVTPQSGSHEQSHGEAEVGRARLGGTSTMELTIWDWAVTATARAAGNNDLGHSEGVCHMGALAP